MYIVSPPEVVSVPIIQSDKRFPVNRVFCLGRNYYWQTDGTEERAPFSFFMKPTSAIVAAEGDLAYPSQTEDFCYEVELVIAIAKDGAHISLEQADEHILGYAIGLDMTRRDQQKVAKETGQSWEAAKAFDCSAPISPIILKEQAGDIQHSEMVLKVNNEVRQHDAIANQMWGIKEAIVHLSRFQALKAGDLIMTGTPKGVDSVVPGDRIHASITGLGTIDMQITANSKEGE